VNRNEINNQNIFDIDWSAQERRAFLKSIPKPKPIRRSGIGRGLPATGLIGLDVSILDRRSVKAQLAGHGDMRAAWWNLNEMLHKFLAPTASTEQIMFSFHRRHHAITLLRLALIADYRRIVTTLINHGVIKGVPVAIRLFQRNSSAER